MAFQTTAFGLDLWRFIAGIGIGVELVTIDTYIAELVPRHVRGRAFAFNQVVQFSAIPAVAFLAWLLVPHAPFGLDGWRWVVLAGSAGAVVVWFIRLAVPESPRWLAATRPARRGEPHRRRASRRKPWPKAGRCWSRQPEPAAAGGARQLRRDLARAVSRRAP